MILCQVHTAPLPSQSNLPVKSLCAPPVKSPSQITPRLFTSFCTQSDLYVKAQSNTSLNLIILYYYYFFLIGQVFLDGVDVTKLNVRWLRSQIGYVGQEPVLFQGSVADNIAKVVVVVVAVVIVVVVDC